MERKVKVVCWVVGFLGLSTAVLAFLAEAIRIANYPGEFGPRYECAHGSLFPSILGLAAVLAILISQILLNVSAGCICCTKSPRFHDSSWGLALLCFILYWFTFVIAFLQLLNGMLFGSFCHGLRPGVFSGGAMLAIASTTFGIVYYLMVTAGVKSSRGSNSYQGGIAMGSNPNEGNMAMGQPQIPPISQDPIFVHEDTYMRRQFT